MWMDYVIIFDLTIWRKKKWANHHILPLSDLILAQMHFAVAFDRKRFSMINSESINSKENLIMNWTRQSIDESLRKSPTKIQQSFENIFRKFWRKVDSNSTKFEDFLTGGFFSFRQFAQSDDFNFQRRMNLYSLYRQYCRNNIS